MKKYNDDAYQEILDMLSPENRHIPPFVVDEAFKHFFKVYAITQKDENKIKKHIDEFLNKKELDNSEVKESLRKFLYKYIPAGLDTAKERNKEDGIEFGGKPKKLGESMDFKDRVRMFLEGRGHKALGTSAGLSEKETKKELGKLDRTGVTANIKKNAAKASNPEAYKWGVIRKILKAHAAKK